MEDKDRYLKVKTSDGNKFYIPVARVKGKMIRYADTRYKTASMAIAASKEIQAKVDEEAAIETAEIRKEIEGNGPISL